EHQFKRKANPGPSHSAIRENWAFVTCHRECSAAICGKIVRSRQNARNLRSFETRRKGIGGISAGIDRRFAVNAKQPAISIRVTRNTVVMLPAIGARNEVLTTI